MKAVAVIPAYNEEKYINAVVMRTRPHVDHIVVVDDGSSDNTAKEAKISGAEVIVSPKNEGKTKAIKRGIERCKDYDVVVLIDGDLQHCPEEIPLLLECAKKNDLCIGSRFLDTPKSMPLANRFSNKFAMKLISLLCGVKVTDPQSGFRAVKTEKLRELELNAERYAVEHIMILEAAKKGFTIGEVSVSCIYGEEKTSIRPFRDTLTVMYYILAFLLRR